MPSVVDFRTDRGTVLRDEGVLGTYADVTYDASLVDVTRIANDFEFSATGVRPCFDTPNPPGPRTGVWSSFV